MTKKKTADQQRRDEEWALFAEGWNDSTPDLRKQILKTTRWRDHEGKLHRYSDTDVHNMSQMDIAGHENSLNGTTAESLFERTHPKPPSQPEGCLSSFIPGRRS